MSHKIIYSNIDSYSRRKPLITNYIQQNNTNCILLVETKTSIYIILILNTETGT